MNVALKDYLNAVAVETARMSYPGHMSPVLTKGAKELAQCYFAEQFPLQTLWRKPAAVTRSFNKWHPLRTHELARALKKKVGRNRDYDPDGIATKLLNTFLHPLMKYKRCRPLYEKLHLPLDEEVFKALRRIWNKDRPESLRPIEKFFRGKGGRNPYTLKYAEYRKIQEALGGASCRIPCERKQVEFSNRVERTIVGATRLNWSLVAGHWRRVA